MTTQDIIQQTKSFTKQEKQQLAYYFLFSSIDEEERKQFTNLFHYKDDTEHLSTQKNNKTLDKFMKSNDKEEDFNKSNLGITNLLKYKGILEGVDLSDISEEELYLQED